jgi:hypothetical protein
MSPLSPNFLLRLSIAGFNIFLDSSIYLSDALFKLSTNFGSSANHIGHLKILFSIVIVLDNLQLLFLFFVF